MMLKSGVTPPAGFKPGRHFNAVEKPKLAENLGSYSKPKAQALSDHFGGSRWYNNGVQRIRVTAGSSPPEGEDWKPGSGGTWYTNGTQHVLVHLGAAAPDGFLQGRVETGQWYNNGSNNVRVKAGAQPPEGYQPGRFIGEAAKAKMDEGRRNGAVAAGICPAQCELTPKIDPGIIEM
jgi:hypothetical protein